MNLTITTTTNGYILKHFDGEVDLVAVVEDHGTEAEVQQRLLGMISELLGLEGSRHAAQRLYLVLAPGDKNHNFTEEHANVIWGKYEHSTTTEG